MDSESQRAAVADCKATEAIADCAAILGGLAWHCDRDCMDYNASYCTIAILKRALYGKCVSEVDITNAATIFKCPCKCHA